MLWGCFVASCKGCFEFVQGTMKSEDYQSTVKGNVLHRVRKLGLTCRSHNRINPKHRDKNT